MTTIVYRDGVLAADRRAYSGDKKGIGAKTKIHRLDDGTLWGVSSCNVGADALIKRWVEAGCEPVGSDQLKPESFELLLVRPTGEIFYANGNLDLSGPLTADYFAIGSGDHFAMGAMAMGASAIRAVEIASDLDVWSGEGMTVLEL
ncbi:hypothetical protein [uncultured Brevundimonas sp.]|uniref:hypothetical protein n=1 Tax=uncultured Brevundimonas sp. TaxID=213418 RepID=UPI0025E4C518|nr:hypothetical protein [uncultured Brevundimonas sp.]